MSKFIDEKSLLKLMEEVGLSEKDSRVYLALLPLPHTGTGALIKATGLHGQFVYAALERLEKLGLARHATERGRKKFSANPPERIVGLIEEKKLTARRVVEQLKDQFKETPQEFEVFQGASAIAAHELELLAATPKGSCIHVIDSGGDQYMALLGYIMNEYERLRTEKQVRIRLISTSQNYNYLKIMAQTRPFFEYRTLSHAVSGVDTRIYPDSLTTTFYGSPVTTFSFKNSHISQGYRGFFEVLWALAAA